MENKIGRYITGAINEYKDVLEIKDKEHILLLLSTLYQAVVDSKEIYYCDLKVINDPINYFSNYQNISSSERHISIDMKLR